MDTEPLARAARALKHVELLVLFGSAAAERMRPDSDVDVGVLIDADSFEIRTEIIATLGRVVERPIDVVFIRDAPPQLAFEIAKGQLLFERHGGIWRDMKARAMLEWWDWQETARWMHQIYADRLRKQVEAGRGS